MNLTIELNDKIATKVAKSKEKNYYTYSRKKDRRI